MSLVAAAAAAGTGVDTVASGSGLLAAVRVQGSDDALLVDLVLLRRRRGLDLAVLAGLFRLGLPLGLLACVGLGLPPLVLASVERGLELAVAFAVLEAAAKVVREVEVLALPAQEVVGKSGWKKWRGSDFGLLTKLLRRSVFLLSSE